MSDRNVAEIRKLLKDAAPAFKDNELRHDLWPKMLRRMEESPLRVPWWDWALLGAAIAATCAFPNVLPALLFHL
jgi:hypothetical protein